MEERELVWSIQIWSALSDEVPVLLFSDDNFVFLLFLLFRFQILHSLFTSLVIDLPQGERFPVFLFPEQFAVPETLVIELRLL